MLSFNLKCSDRGSNSRLHDLGFSSHAYAKETLVATHRNRIYFCVALCVIDVFELRNTYVKTALILLFDHRKNICALEK